METNDLIIVESASSLDLTESQDGEEEDEPAPGLSKLTSSCSASDDESSKEEHESSPVGESASAEQSTQSAKEAEDTAGKSISKVQVGAVMGSVVSKEEEESSENAKDDAETADECCDETPSGEPSKTDEAPLEILHSEQQGDGSLHIEVKDDGCGGPEEGPGAKIQRLARKAGIIVGGGTMTAVGTVMLFLPCPTPSIYLMIGGMAIMSKEVPAAQRQLDITRGNLEVWVNRAEQEFAAAGRTINIVVDSGSPRKKELKKEDEEEAKGEEEEDSNENETPTPIASTQVVYQAHNPVKKHFVKSCRNVILPLLSKVCTPQDEMKEGVVEKAKEKGAATKDQASPVKIIPAEPEIPVNEDLMEELENAEPWESPFARWARYRENRRKELLKLEEQKEREAMLARINEANLHKLTEDYPYWHDEANGDDVVQEVPTEEEDEDDDKEEDEEEVEETPPALTQVQENSSIIIRV